MIWVTVQVASSKIGVVIDQLLEGPDDVNTAIEKLQRGESVLVVAGEFKRRPKSWLVQEAARAAGENGATVRGPQ